MLITLHVAISLINLLFSFSLAIFPAKRLIPINWVGHLLTVVSGIAVLRIENGSVTRACITGIIYVVLVAVIKYAKLSKHLKLAS